MGGDWPVGEGAGDPGYRRGALARFGVVGALRPAGLRDATGYLSCHDFAGLCRQDFQSQIGLQETAGVQECRSLQDSLQACSRSFRINLQVCIRRNYRSKFGRKRPAGPAGVEGTCRGNDSVSMGTGLEHEASGSRRPSAVPSVLGADQGDGA